MLPHGKTVAFFEPVSKTNGATASGYIDRLGYDHAVINIALSASDDATNKPSVMVLKEGDTTSAFANVSGFVGGTDFTVGNQLTNAANNHQFNVDLRGRKRYLQILVSPVTTQVISAVAFLGRAKDAPVNATEAGILNFVSG